MQRATCELLSRPADSVASLKFAKGMGPNLLGVADWSGAVSIYDTVTRGKLAEFPFQEPALSVDFLPNRTLVTGGADMNVYNTTMRGDIYKIGVHTAPVSEVTTLPTLSHSMIVSGGWDKMVALWDVRKPGSIQSHIITPGKVFAMTSMGDNSVIVATSGRYVYVYDVRNLEKGPVQRRESALRHQSRSICANPSGTGFALGSVEGRVAVEYIDPSPSVQAQRFAFKTHRKLTDDGKTVSVYPVHDISFNPQSDNVFITAGGDGDINVWDITRRRRIGNCTVGDGDVGLVSSDFNNDGSLLAVASSYCWEYGRVDPTPSSGVYIINFRNLIN